MRKPQMLAIVSGYTVRVPSLTDVTAWGWINGRKFRAERMPPVFVTFAHHWFGRLPAMCLQSALQPPFSSQQNFRTLLFLLWYLGRESNPHSTECRGIFSSLCARKRRAFVNEPIRQEPETRYRRPRNLPQYHGADAWFLSEP